MSFILLTGSLLISFIIAKSESRVLKDSFMSTGQSLAAYMSKISSDPLIMKDSIQLDEIVMGASRRNNIAYAVIYNEQGAPISSEYASINYYIPNIYTILSKFSKSYEFLKIIDLIKKQESVIEISQPILTGSTVITTNVIGRVVIGLSSDQISNEYFKTILLLVAFNLMLAIILAIVLFFISNKMIFAPLQEIADASCRLSTGDLSTVVKTDATGEIKTLVESFNAMVRSLEKVTISKDYVDHIFNGMINALIVTSPNDVIVRVNAAAWKLLGYEEKELMGLQLGTVFSKDRSNRDSWRKAILDGYPINNVEEWWISKSGRAIPVLLSASVIRDENNLTLGIAYAANDITDRKQAEEELKKSLSLLSASLESTADGILIVDKQGKITKWNQKFAKMWKIPEKILSSHDDTKAINYILTQLADPGRFTDKVRQLYEQPDQSSFDMIHFVDKRIFERFSQPQRIENTIVGRVWSFRDITERKIAEEELKAALQEKEILLREIHHRVKNNMQMISSLLALQAERVKNEPMRQVFIESQQRILAMAMIHETLYSGESLASVDLSDYLKRLVCHLQGVYNGQAAVGIILELDKVELNIDLVVPCGLIINELLTNAFKHAFPRGSKGTIQIKNYLVNERELVLEVSDNGVGLPADLDLENPSSLGLKLVKGLLKHQLRGSWNVTVGKGTTFILRWPLRW